MEPAFDRLIAEIRACTICAPHLPLGPHPVLRGPPKARNLARLCLEKLRGSAYDAAVCFALAPDYVQGFPR